jgi:hypothetical protein
MIKKDLEKVCQFIFIIYGIFILSSCDSSDTLGDTSKVSYLSVKIIPSLLIVNSNDSLIIASTRSIGQGSTKVSPLFTYHDSIGIFAEGGTQIPFALPLSENEYKSSTTISAEGWSTKIGKLYAVYHPYNFYNRDGGHLYWDLRKVQSQSINNTPIDLGKTWILASDTCSNHDNVFSASVSMYNTVIYMYCQVPNVNDYTKMVITTDDKVFPTYGYFDLFDISGSKTALPTTYQPFHALEYSNHVTLKFMNCEPIVKTSGNYVAGYICLPDINMIGRTLTCYLWDTYGNCYVSSKILATTSTGNGAWKRNTTVTIVMPNATLTTTPYTNLNPWEEDKDTCSTCYPVAF